MSTNQIIPNPEAIRQAYIEDFLKRRSDAKEFAAFTEMELVKFIRKFDTPSFVGIYECSDHNFYDRVRNRIATNPEMSAEDVASGLLYSIHLREYSNFLESKAFKNLTKQRFNTEGKNSSKAVKKEVGNNVPSNIVPPFREETEGERKHVTKEMDVIHRNPQLRQQCLDKYGYQCQCCGMNFAEMYGAELGGNFIEVHHLKPISTYETDGVPEDFMENLVPLCSNCHSMIHHLKECEHPLRALREAFVGEKKELQITKAD